MPEDSSKDPSSRQRGRSCGATVEVGEKGSVVGRLDNGGEEEEEIVKLESRLSASEKEEDRSDGGETEDEGVEGGDKDSAREGADRGEEEQKTVDGENEDRGAGPP